MTQKTLRRLVEMNKKKIIAAIENAVCNAVTGGTKPNSFQYVSITDKGEVFQTEEQQSFLPGIYADTTAILFYEKNWTAKDTRSDLPDCQTVIDIQRPILNSFVVFNNLLNDIDCKIGIEAALAVE